MGKVIAVMQAKGGATKTTTSINLAAAINELGHKAIVADMDADKPDATLWANHIPSSSLVNLVVELFEKNPTDSLEELKEKYDYIVIDTPPNLESAALKAAMLSDIALIPCCPSFLDMKSLESAYTAAKMANKPFYLFGSKIKKNTKESKRLLNDIASSGKGLNTYITDSVKMTDSISQGEWIGVASPRSNQHIEFLNLAKEIINTIQ